MMMNKTMLLSLRLCTFLFVPLLSTFSIAVGQEEEGWQRVTDVSSELAWWKRISEDIATEIKQNPTYLRERVAIVANESTLFTQQLIATMTEHKLTQRDRSVDRGVSRLTYNISDIDDTLLVRFRYGKWEYQKSYKKSYQTITALQGWQKKIVAGPDMSKQYSATE